MIRRLSILFLFAFALALPTAALAADATFFGPIVPNGTNGQPDCNCPGAAPDYGCVMQTVQNGMNLAISLSFMLAVLYLVVVGFTFVLSAGSPGARETARKRFMNVVVGIIVILAAWLIVDFIMKRLYGEQGQWGPWNAILQVDSNADMCLKVAANPPALPGVIGGNADGVPTTGDGSIPAGVGQSGLDIDKAVAYLNLNAESHSTNKCALYVRLALAAGGLTSFNTNHPGYAYQYGPYLTNAGFKSIGQAGCSAPKKGDVVVFQPIPGHTSGHIAMFNGSQWVSDFKQQSIFVAAGYQNGSYACYRP